MRRRPRAALIKTINLDCGGGRLFLSGLFFLFLAALCPRTTLTEMMNISAPACVGSQVWESF